MHSPSIQDAPNRILVADDDPVSRATTMHTLSQLGFEADEAVDGEAVLEALVQTTYSIIFMDCQMPRLDGYGATQRIRALDGGFPQPLMIALTGLVTESNRTRCYDVGMDDCLRKPAKPEELALCLDRGTLRQMAGERPCRAEGRIANGRIAGGRDGELKLLRLYLNDAPLRLAAMRTALDADDAHGMENAAHTLKGSSGVVGALDLAKSCEILEFLSECGLFEQARNELLHCEAAFQQVHLDLETRIATIEAGLQASKELASTDSVTEQP